MADISKIKLAGESTARNIKDAQGRADMTTLLGGHALAGLGSAAWLGVDASMTDGATGVATTGVIKSYVDAQVGAINKFDVVVYASISDRPAASANTMYKLALVGGESAEAGTYTEYITVRSGTEGSYTYAWEKIGTTAADLDEYLQETATVAGIEFGADQAITIDELSASTALNLKALSHKDNASGSTTLDTVDSITMKSVTVAGNAAVTHTASEATLSKADYTPAGSITGTAINGGTISVTVKDATASTEATLTRGDYTPAGAVTLTKNNAGSFQVAGTNASSPVTFTKADDTFVKSLKAGTVDAASFQEGAFTPASISDGFFNAGTSASYSHSGFSGGSFTKGTAVSATTEGITASVGTGDDAETLIFTSAATDEVMDYGATFSAAVYGTDTFTANTLPSIDVSKFDGGSKAADTFSANKLPVVDATANAITGLTDVVAAAQTFTGDKYAPAFSGTLESGLKVTKAEYYKQEINTATFTGSAATLGFSGTKVENALVTGVTYDKADASAAFSETVTPSVSAINRTAKTIEITVS